MRFDIFTQIISKDSLYPTLDRYSTLPSPNSSSFLVFSIQQTNQEPRSHLLKLSSHLSPYPASMSLTDLLSKNIPQIQPFLFNFTTATQLQNRLFWPPPQTILYNKARVSLKAKFYQNSLTLSPPHCSQDKVPNSWAWPCCKRPASSRALHSLCPISLAFFQFCECPMRPLPHTSYILNGFHLLFPLWILDQIPHA